MAVVEGYAVMRRRGCGPFLRSVRLLTNEEGWRKVSEYARPKCLPRTAE
jgi:hypothetical protein